MVEYRVLSSAMMQDTRTLQFVWGQIVKAIHVFNIDGDLAPEESICKAINESNVNLAKELISRYNII